MNKGSLAQRAKTINPIIGGMYTAVKSSSTHTIAIRGLQYNLREWGRPGQGVPLVLLHGWMDVSASFQFLVDCFDQDRWIIAPDWRGYGDTLTETDSYWFPDYLADLDAILDNVLMRARQVRNKSNIEIDQDQVDLVAHSMGGNIACLYAGIRPARIRKLVNLEGYGMPATSPRQAPKRYAQWLDQLKEGPSLRGYESFEAVADRLCKNNPRLSQAFALWLARHWSEPINLPEGKKEFRLKADPAHKLLNPTLYRVEEALACWRQITAPVMLVESDNPDKWAEFTRLPAYRERLLAFRDLRTVMLSGCGHMIHHDKPQELAILIESFLQDSNRPV